MRRKGLRELPGWPLVPMGVVWEFTGPGKYRQHLVRAGPRGQTNFEELTTVYKDAYDHLSVCMLCLSQELTFEVGEKIVHRCLICGLRFWFSAEFE